jgi:hypothetical protein
VLEKIAWRKRCIADLLDSLQIRNILVIGELARLGQSMLECREILSIAAQKNVNVYVVKGAWRLDQNIQNMSLAMVFSAFALISVGLFIHLLGFTQPCESINNPGEQLISQLFGTCYLVVFQDRAFSPPPTC